MNLGEIENEDPHRGVVGIKVDKICAWGCPLGGKKLELAAKMAQDASKSDF